MLLNIGTVRGVLRGGGLLGQLRLFLLTLHAKKAVLYLQRYTLYINVFVVYIVMCG